MKESLTPLGLLLGIACAGCAGTEDAVNVADASRAVAAEEEDEDDDENEVLLAVDEIPAAIKAAATKAVPGLVVQEAERETEDGELVYCVHGTADGEFYEVEVSAAGKVLEIEEDDDD